MTLGGPMLVTEHLVLRPPAREDFEGWVAFHADPETMRFLGGVQPRAAAWRGICAMAGAWHINGFAMFSLIERASGRWVGRVGPWQPEGWPGTEVGWGIAREFCGKGYAREAAIASIDFAFDQLGWDEVIHCINPENTASIRLAERLGAVNRGPTALPAPFESERVDCWAQSAAEWKARRASL
ncbi:GNAT family N-acetyltransferase [Sphingomonas sp. LaA6.9]|uniref:GNAT family N-acetyltransferase n=1 Tax=Sphingomonas sp. LaA6.9 TaxID=2919914 RepID=UPI001F4FED2D|nr:GNAT family N-acetyltransferase [Sphingomonas sp. LaA6.9]MCJ8158978.1 GNAT family N-acetyltransferase [Sphingomonas sp. LaA6.9]